MITIKDIGYNGRLGNQIFQYALLLAINKKKGYDIVIPRANIEKKPCSLNLYTKEWTYSGFELHKIFNSNFTFVDDLSFINNNKSFDEICGMEYDSNVFNINDNTNLNGYFQTETYFSDCRDIILKEFTFNDTLIKESLGTFNINSNETVAIHVRRGDTLGHPLLMSVCNIDYYQKAITDYFSDKNYNFMIFSDDIDWCIDNFGDDDNITYVNSAIRENPHFYDLCLMSMCDHQIVANSSFSWWGAWLNKNENKRVVCPENPWPPINKPEYYPNEWIKI